MTRVLPLLLLLPLVVSYAEPPACAQPYPGEVREYTVHKPIVVHSNERLEHCVLHVAQDFQGGPVVVTDGQAENCSIQNVTVYGRLSGNDPKRDAVGLASIETAYQLDIAGSTVRDCQARNIQGTGFHIKRTSSLSNRGNDLANLEVSNALRGIVLACGDGVCTGDIAAGNIRDNGIEVLSPMVFENLHTWNCGGIGGKLDKLCTVGGQLYIDDYHGKGGWEVNAAGCYFAYVRIKGYWGDGTRAKSAGLMLPELTTVGYVQIDTRASPLSADGTRPREHTGVWASGAGTRILAARVLYARDGTPAFKITSRIALHMLSGYTPTPDSKDPGWGVVFVATNGHDNTLTGDFGNLRAADMTRVKGLQRNRVDIKTAVENPIGMPDKMRDNRITVNGQGMEEP